MILADMFVECLPFPEALTAVLAAEAVCTFVNSLVPLKPSSGHKCLSTAFLLAHVLPVMGVNGFNMLFQVFVLDVILVAAFVGAFEGARIGVGIEMVTETGWTIEQLVAAWPCARKSLAIAWETRSCGAGDSGSCVDIIGRDWRGGGCGVVVFL